MAGRQDSVLQAIPIPFNTQICVDHWPGGEPMRIGKPPLKDRDAMLTHLLFGMEI
jgi:hypothetical protein